MILYILTSFIVLLLFLIAYTDKYSPVIQFNIITGFGFLFLYDEEYKEEGKQVIYQLMLGVLLISLSYTRDAE
jgi:ABC-type antimicrobial peptide transport system permease subunit